jgi:guanosine-3',5'-bis(diphosphate) 3'-pyrophosphohydrolase
MCPEITLYSCYLYDYFPGYNRYEKRCPMSLLNQVLIFAIQRTGDQVDKAHKPYILHPLRVMLNFEEEKEQLTALLHDLMEDRGVTTEELQTLSIPQDVIDAVVTLTHPKEEPYQDYITRILKNELACKIKLADLKDNMNLDRLPVITQKNLDKMQDYIIAQDRIKAKMEIGFTD